ncbi:MAG: carboxypeptidase regulatory-like domain-containing protein [Deltaproteobacteria bacterium]|nr:carboxypeptidase regulatory-like domain-containing protein [Deltaproteobacteria bacterium]
MRNVVVAAIAIGAGVVVMGCGPHLKFDGRVVSCEDKKPIPSANIQYSYEGMVGASASEDHTKTTDKEGKFHLGAVNYSEDTTIILKVEAKGRAPYEQTYQGSSKEEQVICLKKKP